MSDMVYCQHMKKKGLALLKAPYPGELGQRILQNICQESWEAWTSHQTMLINEYRLSMIDRESRQFLEQEMVKFLFEGSAEQPPGYVPEE